MMKPLTIERLKALPHRDWLWIMDLKTKNVMYAQILVNGIIGDCDCRYLCIDGRNAEIDFSTYGKKWLAYKNKEQAEAKGEIVELPCGVGDAVYTIGNAKIAEEKVLEIYIDADSTIFTIGKVYDGVNSFKSYARYYLEQHNKTWFTDKSEAERRLAELKGE